MKEKVRYRYPGIEAAVATYRKTTGSSAVQIAKELNISRMAFFNRLSGVASWTINDIVRIAELTGYTYEQLVAGRYPIEKPEKTESEEDESREAETEE